MRIRMEALLCVGNVDLFQHLYGTAMCLSPAYILMEDNCLHQLLANLVDRAQRCTRFLENHGDFATPYATHLATIRGKIRNVNPILLLIAVVSVVDNLATNHPSGRSNHAHNGSGSDTLAATTLSNDRNDLPSLDRETGASHRMHHAFGQVEICTQVLDLENVVLAPVHD